MVYTTGRVDLEYILHNDPVEAIKGRFERAAEKAAIILYFPFPNDAPLSSTEKEFTGRYFVPPEKVWMLYDIILKRRMTPIQTVQTLGLEKIGYDEVESLANQWTKEGFRQRFDARMEKLERERGTGETARDIIQDMRDSFHSIGCSLESAAIRQAARERRRYGDYYTDDDGFVKRDKVYPHELLNDGSRGLKAGWRGRR